jgi:hypothetical protein
LRLAGDCGFEGGYICLIWLALSTTAKDGRWLCIEPQVHFGGGLAAAVFGPVHAVGDELHSGGVHGVDPHLETPQQAIALAPGGEVQTRVLEMVLFGSLHPTEWQGF